MWERNRALADFDRTHNLQIYGVYELPFGPGKQWATEGLGRRDRRRLAAERRLQRDERDAVHGHVERGTRSTRPATRRRRTR